jgi:hypothetical protein
MATKKRKEEESAPQQQEEKQYDEHHPRPWNEVTETRRWDEDGYAIHPAWCQCNQCQK